MKKLLFIAFICLTSVFSANAQDSSVEFKISPDGTFHAADGHNFVVVPFKGKTAHQIFSSIFVNVSEVFKDPKQKVIITIDGSSVNVRAYDPKLTFTTPGVYCGGYYSLNFEIKDGKVRVDAPQVDDVLTNTKDGTRVKDFPKLTRSWYQEAALQAKYQDNAFYTEAEFNSVINGVLTGNYIGDVDNEW